MLFITATVLSSGCGDSVDDISKTITGIFFPAFSRTYSTTAFTQATLHHFKLVHTSIASPALSGESESVRTPVILICPLRDARCGLVSSIFSSKTLIDHTQVNCLVSEEGLIFLH
jgi:hypothetical protein